MLRCIVCQKEVTGFPETLQGAAINVSHPECAPKQDVSVEEVLEAIQQAGKKTRVSHRNR